MCLSEHEYSADVYAVEKLLISVHLTTTEPSLRKTQM